GQKLERFGKTVLARPEPQAMWPPSAPGKWTPDATFQPAGEDETRGRWDRPMPDFAVGLGKVTMVCRTGQNWHVGLFPEQKPHWDAVLGAVSDLPQPEVLNLFGYTGAASLLLAAHGARVTHVDASRKAIAWGKECQAASGLNDAAIRWMCDDAQKFVAREVRRGRTYHAILLDPPKFGRGPKNETWSIFEDLPLLMADLAHLVSRETRIVILTAYAIRASALAVGRTLSAAFADRGGHVEAGELALSDAHGRLLPTSMYAEWRP
ncbi:MAG: class I SAM-dependent methyltransferase, partial [Pseudomonadota bacterium]